MKNMYQFYSKRKKNIKKMQYVQPSKPGNFEEPCELCNISLSTKFGLSSYQNKHNNVNKLDIVL